MKTLIIGLLLVAILVGVGIKRKIIPKPGFMNGDDTSETIDVDAEIVSSSPQGNAASVYAPKTPSLKEQNEQCTRRCSGFRLKKRRAKCTKECHESFSLMALA
jgi:hypothetical protein